MAKLESEPLISTFANFALLPKWEIANSMKSLKLGNCVSKSKVCCNLW